jgi:hypothetical protein
MIVAYLGRSVNEYLHEFLRKINITILLCPICQEHTLVMHGSYQRKFRFDENSDCLPIVRVLCTSCGRTHAILPDFIAPYRHIAAQHIAKATADILEGRATAETAEGPQEASTSRRWVQRFEQDFNNISGMLQSILIQTINLYLPLNKLPTIWEEFCFILKALPHTDHTSHIGQANLWLLISQTQIWV